MSKYDLGVDGTAWVVDVVGRLWFTTGVTQDTPQGSGQWWQVMSHQQAKGVRHWPQGCECSFGHWVLKMGSEAVEEVALKHGLVWLAERHHD